MTCHRCMKTPSSTPLSVVFFFNLLLLCILATDALGQCNTLKPQITIDFNTDQACAPVSVTKFEITYYFTVPQNPNDIQIRYVWNDPANTTTTIDTGTGLIAGAGNTTFKANATFTYTDNAGCTITPTVRIIINGVVCTTSEQIQTAFFWGTEDEGNAAMSMTPDNYDVCFNNPIANAVFTDNSEFNCNPAVEPDQPNVLQRHVQFVYGTNHNPSNAIRDLSLMDGGTQPLTNASGALVNPVTKGVPAVTGAYFGPIQPVPFPANGPNAVSLPMNAPANTLNGVGDRFQVTLYNWNTCNPWNGSVANPNYGDAVVTTAYVRIVDAPAPEFETRDDLANPTTDFCINEVVYFANQTPNLASYDYEWTFYDDNTGVIEAGTSNSQNPTFTYTTGGQKLIKLVATNTAAQGSCVEEVTHLINVTPALTAEIEITDITDTPITPSFCQEASAPLNTFTVRFKDVSPGTAGAQTRWRWEFYDENDMLFRQEPTGGGYSSVQLGPFDIPYINPGNYKVKLHIIDQITMCGTTDEVEVHVYEKPVPVFTASLGCEGQPVAFEDASTLNPINGESIVLREWDFDYDGMTFSKDPAYDNETDFSRLLGTSGTYQVALRITTDQGACSAISVNSVEVNPIPTSSFTPNVTSGCSTLNVTFTNTAVNGQPDTIDRYEWEVNNGSGYVTVGTQDPADPNFSPVFIYDFENTTLADKQFDVRLRTITVNGCEMLSSVSTITVRPGTNSAFRSLNYSPFNDNCSPVSVDFSVDLSTRALSPVDYTWRVSDLGGVIREASTGTTPMFTHQFINTSALIKDFTITLITQLPSGCYGDSTRVIRVSPVPSAAFKIDTVQFDCNRMRLRLIAEKRGLQYHWKVLENSIVMLDDIVADDIIEYEVLRPSSDVNLSISLSTKNLTNCTSSTNTKSLMVPRRDIMNASFTVSPAIQTLPNSTITITNTTNSGPWTYHWDFGDGTTSSASGPTIQHTYGTYGAYNITLSVTNNVCTNNHTKSAIIEAIPPIVDFEYEPNKGCVPLTVRFKNKSKYAEADKYVWEFGEGQATSKAIDPTYTYYQAGKHTVSLSATNLTGQTIKETKELIIEAYPLPEAQFDVKPKTVNIPGGVLFTSNRSFQANEFLWDFGDGSTSTEVQPQHAYVSEGSYAISLIARNQYGCSDTVKVDQAVYVVKGGQVLVPNAFSPNPTGSTGHTPDAGKNDVFLPLMKGVTEFELLIFDRWGVLVFQTRDEQYGWDGYYNGKLCPQDVYVYKLTASFSNGEKIVRVGDVNLVR
jgi:gliding motility-associated-like protein